MAKLTKSGGPEGGTNLTECSGCGGRHCGGGIAGLTQVATATLRANSNVLTGGLGNPVIATAELGGALLVPLVAIRLIRQLRQGRSIERLEIRVTRLIVASSADVHALQGVVGAVLILPPLRRIAGCWESEVSPVVCALSWKGISLAISPSATMPCRGPPRPARHASGS